MTSDRGDHRVLAVDAAVEFAASKRLTPMQLAAAMTPISRDVQLGRWAKSLTSLAQAYTSGFVVETLTALLPTVSAKLHGVHTLLEVLLEETIRMGGEVTDVAMRRWLEQMPVGGRAARAARQLLLL
jgi:hypothetical protein